MKYTYEFQFNNDIASCLALMAMINAGWGLEKVCEHDGFTWFVYSIWRSR